MKYCDNHGAPQRDAALPDRCCGANVPTSAMPALLACILAPGAVPGGLRSARRRGHQRDAWQRVCGGRNPAAGGNARQPGAGIPAPRRFR